MDDLRKGTLIRYGFWLGVGFALPLLLISVAGSVIFFAGAVSYTEHAVTSASPEAAWERPDANPEAAVKVLSYRDVRNGDRLYILGEIRNEGGQTLGSVNLEAEMFDSDNTFVFECSEYVQKNLGPGDSENSKMNCGCSGQEIPEYATINMRVVSAYER